MSWMIDESLGHPLAMYISGGEVRWTDRNMAERRNVQAVSILDVGHSPVELQYRQPWEVHTRWERSVSHFWREKSFVVLIEG